MTPEQISALIKDHNDVRANRATWESHWQDIRELVRPSGEDTTRQTSQGRIKTQNIFDSTAPDACEQLAAGMQSYLMSPVERWFTLRAKGLESTTDRNVLGWLELVADIIYAEFQSAETGFDASMSEVFLDLASYGTTCENVEWNHSRNRILFRAFPLRDLWIRENVQGRVDTVHRSMNMNMRQFVQAFGEPTPKMKDSKEPDRHWEIIHVVRPRTDRSLNSVTSTNMPFASYWLNRDTSEVISEGGYRQLPYLVARWLKLSDETYGRSPAMKALADIKMLNSMAKTVIKVAQKAADPPLIVPNDGFLLPLNTHPGALIFKEPGVEQIEQLPSGDRNLPITREILQDMREKIKVSFHADWLRLEKENKEMTAFEVQDRRDEKLRFLAPTIGRLQSELLGPLIQRTVSLMWHHRKLPPPPPAIEGRPLVLEYTSPAAKAQQGIKALDMERFVADTLPLAQVDPGILDAIDFDKLTAERARYRGVSRMILRSPEEIEEIRAARQEQQQIQQAAEIAQPAAKAMKDIASAQQLTP